MNNKKKIVIVGGSSYIAQKFIEYYENTYDIKIISRTNIEKNNLKIVNDYFSIEEEDFQDCDIVINFVAIVHQPKIKNKLLYLKINTELPLYIAKLSKKAGCGQFIQLSTIAVYGSKELINVSAIESPKSIYGKTKLDADTGLLKLNTLDFKISIIRPSMVYGDQAPGNINTLKKIIKFYYILPFKGINNQRNFIHVLNLVQVIHGIIEKGISGKIIVADETSISTYQLVRCLSKLNAKKRVFINVNFIWHIVNKLAPDLGKKITGNLKIVNNYSYEYLGLSKIYTLKEGLEEMLN